MIAGKFNFSDSIIELYVRLHQKRLSFSVSFRFFGNWGIGGNICSFFGFVNVKNPIGQVLLYSNVRSEEVYITVTASLVIE
jgi:hypothetical protein